MVSDNEVIEDCGDQTADTIATIARCWWYPDDQLTEALDDGLFEEELPTAPPIDELKQEYTRLFIGPGDHPCPPYESIYRNRGSTEGSAQVLGESTRSVEEWYRRYDLAPDSSWSDPPDHIAVELEFTGYLEENDPDALTEFLNEHPQQWMPEFLTAVENHAQMPFYSHLAATTNQVITSIS